MHPLFSINEKINFSVSVKFVEPSFVYDIDVIFITFIKKFVKWFIRFRPLLILSEDHLVGRTGPVSLMLLGEITEDGVDCFAAEVRQCAAPDVN